MLCSFPRFVLGLWRGWQTFRFFKALPLRGGGKRARDTRGFSTKRQTVGRIQDQVNFNLMKIHATPLGLPTFDTIARNAAAISPMNMDQTADMLRRLSDAQLQALADIACSNGKPEVRA